MIMITRTKELQMSNYVFNARGNARDHVVPTVPRQHKPEEVDASVISHGTMKDIDWTIFDEGMKAPELTVFDAEPREPQILQLPESLRIERARQLMDQIEPIPLDINEGDVARLNEDTLIEKSEDGFALYHIQG